MLYSELSFSKGPPQFCPGCGPCLMLEKSLVEGWEIIFLISCKFERTSSFYASKVKYILIYMYVIYIIYVSSRNYIFQLWYPLATCNCLVLKMCLIWIETCYKCKIHNGFQRHLKKEKYLNFKNIDPRLNLYYFGYVGLNKTYYEINFPFLFPLFSCGC